MGLTYRLQCWFNLSAGEGKAKPFWATFGMPKVDRNMIATLGFGAFCAYGVISNINAGAEGHALHGPIYVLEVPPNIILRSQKTKSVI